MSGPQFLDVDTLGNLKPITQAVLSLGANMDDPLSNLQQAVNLLSETPSFIPVEVSSVYRTKPVGFEDQPDFLNIVMIADTTLEPLTLFERCMAIESFLGRRRDIPMGPRTIDIDIIAMGKRTSDTEELTIPHPEAYRRAFVLVPWYEVEPAGKLPGHGPIADLLFHIDVSGVEKTDEVVELP